jgi:glycosyltransferase involved in cell wall biosynthesis
MNLLYLSLALHMRLGDPLGYGTHMREVANALAGRGHRVHRYIAGDGGLVTGDGGLLAEDGGLRAEDRHHPARDGGALGNRAASGGGVGQRLGPLAAATGPARHLLRDLRELVHDRQAPGRLAPILARSSIQAVYERSSFMQLAGLRLARARGLPHILEVNAPIEERRDHHGYPLYRIGVAREREKLALTDQVVCVTTALRRYLEDRGADPARVAVIPNAVRPESFRLADAEREALRARLGVAPGQVAVGFVGRFGYWRGMVPLLEAFALVAAAEPRAHFVLVGGGQLLPEVTRLVGERGLGARVTLTGVLPPDAVPAHVAALDIGVLAGSPWYSSPIKLFEYGAAGLGIVAPRVPAVEEVIRDEAEALLVTPEAQAEIAAAILRLIVHPEERQALARSFQTRVNTDFTWTRVATKIEELFLASPRRSRP